MALHRIRRPNVRKVAVVKSPANRRQLILKETDMDDADEPLPAEGSAERRRAGARSEQDLADQDAEFRRRLQEKEAERRRLMGLDPAA